MPKSVTPPPPSRMSPLIAVPFGFIRIPVSMLRDVSVAADSTGVKAESPRIAMERSGLKSVRLRASWTASNTDSVTAIELYDVTADSVLASLSGNAGADQEIEVKGYRLVKDHLYEVRVNITTASATTGATSTINYATLELTYRR